MGGSACERCPNPDLPAAENQGQTKKGLHKALCSPTEWDTERPRTGPRWPLAHLVGPYVGDIGLGAGLHHRPLPLAQRAQRGADRGWGGVAGQGRSRPRHQWHLRSGRVPAQLQRREKFSLRSKFSSHSHADPRLPAACCRTTTRQSHSLVSKPTQEAVALRPSPTHHPAPSGPSAGRRTAPPWAAGTPAPTPPAPCERCAPRGAQTRLGPAAGRTGRPSAPRGCRARGRRRRCRGARLGAEVGAGAGVRVEPNCYATPQTEAARQRPAFPSGQLFQPAQARSSSIF